MKLYANPYDTSKTGFYFSNLAEYEAGVEKCGAEQIESLDVEEMTALEFLLDCGHDINYALDKFNEVCISSESLDDYAYGLMEELYDVPENLMNYMDYRKFGRDLVLEGSVVELNGYLITNANDF